MPPVARIAVIAKIPGTPISVLSTGPAMMDNPNVSPMVMPIAAMALVRTESRVRSAASAITAAEIAPVPCTVRPTMTQMMS